MMVAVEISEMYKMPVPMPKMDTWKTAKTRMSEINKEEPPVLVSLNAGCEPELAGRFKVHLKTMGIARWILCNELPTEFDYDEWLYIGTDGVPSLYWNSNLNGVMLI